LLIPHQANARIIDYAARTLQLPPEKVFQNVEHYGNTSAASIPLALVEAIEAKRVNPGDHLVMVGFGGGLSWGSCAVEWTAPTDKRLITPQRAAQSRLRYRWANFKSFSHRVLRRVDSGVTHVLDRIEGRQNGHSG